MIKSFKNKGLAELFAKGKTRHIDHRFHAKVLERLTVLDNAENIKDIDVPGYRLHRYSGHPHIWSIDVTGAWRIIFTYEKGHATDVDFTQPH